MKRRFILQAIHPEYACPAFEMMFETERLDELRALLGPDAADDPDLEHHYRLNSTDLAAVTERFGISFDAEGREVFLYARADQKDGYPYLPHTNYELPLLLDGRKKFARMSYEYPPNAHPYEESFDRFVTQGLLHKDVDFEPFDKPIRARSGRVFEGVRTAYYTPPGEEWRIQAWRLVEKAQAKGGWNDTLERLEGMLYGYEDWQNDWWEEYRRRKLRQYGTILVYAALAPSELAAVELSAFRTLPPLDRSLQVIISLQDDLEEAELQQLRQAVERPALVRFRVKARPFGDLVRNAQARTHVNAQARTHVLGADQVKDVNGLLLEKIEVVTAAR